MTYTASDIAKYIVSYCFRKRKPVSNLKLQKMLYYMWIEYYKRLKKAYSMMIYVHGSLDRSFQIYIMHFVHMQEDQ